MPNVGPLEIIVVLGIVLLVFGPKRLPQAGRALGQSMREFKDSLGGGKKGGELDAASGTQTVHTDSSPTATAPAKPAAQADTPPAAQDAAGAPAPDQAQSVSEGGQPPSSS